MPSTNFIQFNPTGANMESDSGYSGDSQRSGGATSGAIFQSVLANKLFYQLSTFITAMAAMMVSKGFSPNDGNANPATAVATLEAILQNICMKSSDIAALLGYTPANAAYTASFANPGYIKFTGFGGLTIMWGSQSVPVTGTTFAFPTPFPHACLGGVCSDTSSSGAGGIQILSASQFILNVSHNSVYNWIAIGY